MIGVPNKVCSTCKTLKPITQFHASRRASGERISRGGLGVAAQCKMCKAEARRPGIHAERASKAWLSDRGLKRCGKCKRELPIAEFHTRRASNDGRAYKCPDCVKAALRKWREDNPDGFRRWYEANRDHRSSYFRNWRAQNLEHRAGCLAEWAKANRDLVNAKNARRHAAKFNATVLWADVEAIKAIYAEAARKTRETGIPYEVDHYYPLQGELVCGLHCEANLQILTKAENIRKLNRMPEDIYGIE